MLNTIKALLALRRKYDDLNADGSFEVLHANQNSPLFVYRRGRLALFVNPANAEVIIARAIVGAGVPDRPLDVVFEIGKVKQEGEQITLSPQSFAVLA